MLCTFAKDNCSLHIDTAALVHNYRLLRSLLPVGVATAGVVKADAYGHGLVETARVLKAEGSEMLAVAHLYEAELLREAGVGGDILVLLGVAPENADRAAELSVTPFCDKMDWVNALAQAGRKAGRALKIHVKVDTGMSRLGVAPREALEFLHASADLEGVEVTGISSHLATAGVPESDYALLQAELFSGLLDEARQMSFSLPESSLQNSGGVMIPPSALPKPPYVVRPGIALYGGLPDDESAGVLSLKGVMSFSTRLIQVREITAGTKVSYGGTWTAKRDTTLGVIPVGYADGYPRALSNRAMALVMGQRVPLRGRVCMNLCMLDMGGLSQKPQVGEPVVLLGRQGGEEILLDELAEWAGTIGYELSCSLGAANPRLFGPA